MRVEDMQYLIVPTLASGAKATAVTGLATSQVFTISHSATT
jgi:hypothetical protein